jgi:outer membrane protein assembly factor BamB
LKAHGITPETWHENLTRGVNCVGHAYATPVSDGTHVYVATADGVFAAFDLAGRRRWLAHAPGQVGEYCRNGRSPILYQGLLISDITATVRAFDRQTGKLLWSDDCAGDSIVSPMVLTVAGKDILWAAGSQAYLLPEGKRLTVKGWKDAGMQTLVKHDERDVVFFCGEGEHCGWTNKGKGVDPMPPAAVRFSLEGDTLQAKVLWSGINGQPWGGNRPWMLYHAGKLYGPGAGAVDALAGKVALGDFTGKSRSSGPVPASQHLLLVANGHVYGLAKSGGKKGDAGGATLAVATLDGKPVSSCTIPTPEPTPAELALIRSVERQDNWPEFAKGYTFTLGPDCVIIRGMARLYCLGSQ